MFEKQMLELETLLKRFSLQDGLTPTAIDNLYVFQASQPKARHPIVYEPVVIVLAYGQKKCYLNESEYDYSAGNYLTLFLPMPIEVEILEASVERPLLAACFRLDLHIIADLLLKLDQVAYPTLPSGDKVRQGIYTAPVDNAFLSITLRLLQALKDPADVQILSKNLVEEFHYRILRSEHAALLKPLLEHRGQIQRISRAVEFINQHLDESIRVEVLAAQANMSESAFHRTFKTVMQMSPLQYVKSIRLLRAQALIREGRTAKQAAHAVGYSSAAQFSRDYKRQFGFAPSETK